MNGSNTLHVFNFLSPLTFAVLRYWKEHAFLLLFHVPRFHVQTGSLHSLQGRRKHRCWSTLPSYLNNNSLFFLRQKFSKLKLKVLLDENEQI